MSDDAGEEDLYGAVLGAGALVGGYLVDALVARGGFARLYRARELATGRRVAIKLLDRELALSSRAIRRFQREAEAASRLRHPHIVEVLEAGALHDGRPYIAMEWLDGRDLAAELRVRGPLTPDEALMVLREVGGALTVAHAAGLVHCDVKAENVIAVPSGEWFRAVLVDFGIARLADEEPRRDPGLTARAGTVRVMAPEQLAGGAVDARTDVYALGLLLFHLVTGRAAFVGDAVELAEAHLHAPAPRASSHAPVPAALDAAIAEALAKRPDDRPASVEAFVERVAGALARPRVVERRPGTAWLVHLVVDERDDGEDDERDPLAPVVAALTALGCWIVLRTADGVLAAATAAPSREALAALARERHLRGWLAEADAELAGDEVVGGGRPRAGTYRSIP